MSLTAILKLALAAGKEAVGKFKDIASGEFNSLKRIFMIAAVVIFLFSLPGIFLEGMFGWMGSADEESIQIDTDYLDGFFDGRPIFFMVNDPTFPDNIPWPATSLQAIGEFHGITWNETEMCNTIYHAYLVNKDDSVADILDKYTKLVEAFAKEDLINPYYFLIRDTLGLELSADERLALEDCYSYTPPWEEK